MTGEWQVVTLGKVAEILMGQSPPGSTYNERMEGLPFFQGIADFDYRHPIPRVYCTAPTRIAQPGDILLSVRAPIGKINIANRECAIGRGLSIIRARDPKEARYIEFALRNMENFWNTIEGGGSVFGNATKDDLEGLSIPWPENRSERSAIAHILGTLDDKIELNRRMSQTLEELAQALFKAWFGDCEPGRVKMQGRCRRGETLPGLPAHLYDLFPDRLVDSQLGMIPEGWEVRMLGELLELAYGKALKADNRQHGTIPVYGSNGQVGWHDEKLVTGPGIIVGRKGNPGVVKWVPTDFFPIDTTFYVIPKDKCPSLHFLFYALDLQNLASLGADSAVPGLNRNLVYMDSQILPSHTLLLTFDSSVKSLFQRISITESESRTLAALRDALLPRLVRGEIRVKDAEKFLQERGL